MTDRDQTVPELPEYRDNPFIAALPPLWSTKETYKALALPPTFDIRERQYPDHIRPHCIMRLSRYFEPLDQHIMLSDRFGMLVRQGYVGRNLGRDGYQRHLQNSIARLETGNLTWRRYEVPNTAASFALVGCSGVGKSTAMERVLGFYPQVIYHSQPISLHQLSWVKIECPQKGGPKQLCINFFSEVDRILGTNYLDKYGKRGDSLDLATQRMAHLASLHALGVLVVDEVQHLLRTRGMDAEDVLNFLVTLVNTIGVPVILIGTLNAIDVLQGKFRQARRASGIGSMVWDRMAKGGTWDHFVRRLWEYQWTQEYTPLDPELNAVLYDESQGIIDIAIKLFMLAQMKAIRLRLIRKRPERLDAQLFRQVAKEDFRLIRPMIEALRQNDLDALRRYDDLLPFHEHLQQVFESSLGGGSGRIETSPLAETPPNDRADGKESTGDSVPEQVRAALSSLGLAPDVAELMIKEAIAADPSCDPLHLIGIISEKLRGQQGKVPTKKLARAAKPTQAKELAPEDLRRVAEEARQSKMDVHGALLQAGAIKPPLQDLAA
jgi:hypothetical protein